MNGINEHLMAHGVHEHNGENFPSLSGMAPEIKLTIFNLVVVQDEPIQFDEHHGTVYLYLRGSPLRLEDGRSEAVRDFASLSRVCKQFRELVTLSFFELNKFHINVPNLAKFPHVMDEWDQLIGPSNAGLVRRVSFFAHDFSDLSICDETKQRERFPELQRVEEGLRWRWASTIGNARKYELATQINHHCGIPCGNRSQRCHLYFDLKDISWSCLANIAALKKMWSIRASSDVQVNAHADSGAHACPRRKDSFAEDDVPEPTKMVRICAGGDKVYFRATKCCEQLFSHFDQVRLAAEAKERREDEAQRLVDEIMGGDECMLDDSEDGMLWSEDESSEGR